TGMRVSTNRMPRWFRSAARTTPLRQRDLRPVSISPRLVRREVGSRRSAAWTSKRKEPTMSTRRNAPRIALWIVQGLLAALFLFAGGFKLAMPAPELSRLAHLPAGFLKFIGTCEVLGALGLVLPGLFRVRPGLTPLAAAGLVIIMTGAV